ncbi:MAG: GNAT family N-acetyltransferase [bacterium]|nr:GNAT family N-acetyltransferase [bacterium]
MVEVQLFASGEGRLLALALVLRGAVFVDEQGVPVELEFDDHDLQPQTLHALGWVDGQPVGAGRLVPAGAALGKVGRMAVLPGWRGRGVGRALLTALLAAAREQGLQTVRLDAQTHAIDFYRKAGFAIVAAEFLDAGIPHVTMCRRL